MKRLLIALGLGRAAEESKKNGKRSLAADRTPRLRCRQCNTRVRPRTSRCPRCGARIIAA